MWRADLTVDGVPNGRETVRYAIHEQFRVCLEAHSKDENDQMDLEKGRPWDDKGFTFHYKNRRKTLYGLPPVTF